MQETWFILEDGRNADPNEVAPDASGKLMHKSGVAVAIGAHGNPRSRGVDADAERAKAVSDGKMSPNEARGKAGKPPIESKQDKTPDNREVKAEEPAKTYETR